ncbi:hypothetical protein AT15_07365 [Kosmotoga arenicorallina S304]|uniref:Tetratricopeptide repeat protein n=1 Tax=Kosmotoga arenicorallina S304 TaxID=1453497 RepID=A0A182C769_9BACT|nr:tetratricopeptide repeat protein [Kosmotoga arenicorallina]OAA31307.1 hypothetical protein AT15_07365 [Kosmotoga arenicorallina S304]
MPRHEILIYLPLKPSVAKIQNLPIKLPVRIEDVPKIVDRDKIDLDIIIRGLETQHRVKPNEYYDSYLLYFYYEAFKKSLNNGDIEQAKDWLGKAEKLKVDYRYFFYHGLLLREIGKLNLAEIELRKAVEMNQNFYIGYFELARLLQKKGEYDEAVKFHIKSLEQSHGEFDLPLLGVVDSYSASGMLSSALEILEHIPSSSRIFVDALLRKGVILNELQRHADAEKAFNIALRREKRWELFYNRAYARERLGKLYPALTDLKEAFKMSSAEEILYDIALLEREMGFVEDAIEHLTLYLDSNSDTAAEVALARCFLMLGDPEKAKGMLPDSAPEDLKEYINLCSLLKEKGRKDHEFANPLFSGLLREYKTGKIGEKTDKLRELSSSLLGANSLFEGGYIDYQKLMEWSLKSLSDTTAKSRIRGIMKGKVPDEREISVDELKLFIRFLPFFGFAFGSMELFARRFAFILSGSGETLAMFLMILRLYSYALADEAVDIYSFIEEMIEEFRSFAFEFSRFIAEVSETHFIDADTALESVSETPREFLVKILSLVRTDAIDEASKTDNIYTYFRRYL